ncbi:hypothetical protein AB9F35_15010 [Rhizobium leguminosarum]|uniref:hypothetical protein n=1 Tax=Rhizobium leguminosarum TaxID=384 RepID=UPI003F99D253
MNSYTDESGFDGIVPAHPIECEGTAEVSANRAQRARHVEYSFEQSPALKELGMMLASKAAGVSARDFAKIMNLLERGYNEAKVAELEAMAGTGDKETADRIIDVLGYSLHAGWKDEFKALTAAILVKHRQQAVAEAIAGMEPDWLWYRQEGESYDNIHNALFDGAGYKAIMELDECALLRTRFHFMLPASDDADSDDNRIFSFDTKEEAVTALSAATQRGEGK